MTRNTSHSANPNPIWRLFVGDLRRISGNVVSIIIVIGLVAIPSLFTWFNVAASWNPLNNTKNLTFAVASVDEGYKSDLVPLKVNVGDQVISALRANGQLAWTFTTKDDAIDGTKSGKYYAAVVIPESFSRDMMTFFDDDVTHAKLSYYTNEKKNALAPHVTGEGADEVAAEINQIFAKTLSDVALNIASSLSNYLDDADTKSRIANLNGHIGEISGQLADAADTLGTYSELVDSADSLLSSSSTLLNQASGAAKEVSADASGAKQSVGTISDAMSSSATSLSKALKTSADSYRAVGDDIDKVYDAVGTQSTNSAKSLRDQADAVNTQIESYTTIRRNLASLADQMGSLSSGNDVSGSGIGETAAGNVSSAINSALTQLDSVIALQTRLRDNLNAAAGRIESGNATAQKDRAQIKALATQAKNSVGTLRSDFDSDIKPKLDELSANVSTLAASLNANSGKLDEVTADLTDGATSASGKMASVKQTLNDTARQLNDSANKIKATSENVSSALNSGDVDALKKALGSDPESLAASLTSPVGVTRRAVFPVSDFGSALAPFYTFLPLWVGSLLMAVTLKTNVSRRIRAQLGDPRPHQMYLGRFGVFAVLSLLQSTCLCLGNLLFLHVQAVHPLLYMLSGWLGGLTFIFMIYTLVVSFGNVGKAIGVLFLVVQISGSGGAYPLSVMPDFFQNISPFLPATHAINAMRAATAGIYQNDYWKEIGMLLLFVLPTLLLGLVLRKPLVKFNTWYVAKVESTKLIS
ncbi:phage infection protein [Bifidobacterium margollesii]|uniref:Phage infection protein n=1 Tax=Bifidobacterium margollesii TaxID=2020964 RepID=A0A2N5JC89_9BIFI|nr:YhgE/Pip domain-containing protein [Bifidobacterium margollesii]PLS31825.1 phage infection protein [Bifidobacterium margollesii]